MSLHIYTYVYICGAYAYVYIYVLYCSVSLYNIISQAHSSNGRAVECVYPLKLAHWHVKWLEYAATKVHSLC